jgi:hypothetical protein
MKARKRPLGAAQGQNGHCQSYRQCNDQETITAMGLGSLNNRLNQTTTWQRCRVSVEELAHWAVKEALTSCLKLARFKGRQDEAATLPRRSPCQSTLDWQASRPKRLVSQRVHAKSRDWGVLCKRGSAATATRRRSCGRRFAWRPSIHPPPVSLSCRPLKRFLLTTVAVILLYAWMQHPARWVHVRCAGKPTAFPCSHSSTLGRPLLLSAAQF